MRFDENGDRLDLAGAFEGAVADANDPKHLGRIRATVPGLWEPAGPWLDPLLPGTGPGVGVWSIPPRGARVVVLMAGGGRSVDRGWYVPAGWRGVGELPTEIADGPTGVTAVFNDRYTVVLDSRAETRGASIVDRLRGDTIRLDGTDLSIEISATTDVRVQAGGTVDISGALVLIQGRAVLPSNRRPI